MIRRDIGQSEGLKKLTTKIRIAREAISQCESLVKKFRLDDQKSTIEGLHKTLQSVEQTVISAKELHDSEAIKGAPTKTLSEPSKVFGK